MIWGYDHVIVGMVISGLELNHFWACNAPMTSTCPLGETTVQIVARLRFLNLLATSVPAMTQDHRSHDLDDIVQINASNLCPPYLWTRLALLESTVQVLFAILDSGSLKSQTQLSLYFTSPELAIYGHLSCKSMTRSSPGCLTFQPRSTVQ
jgi:hypothetical protein